MIEHWIKDVLWVAIFALFINATETWIFNTVVAKESTGWEDRLALAFSAAVIIVYWLN